MSVLGVRRGGLQEILFPGEDLFLAGKGDFGVRIPSDIYRSAETRPVRNSPIYQPRPVPGGGMPDGCDLIKASEDARDSFDRVAEVLQRLVAHSTGHHYTAPPYLPLPSADTQNRHLVDTSKPTIN